MSRVVGGLLAAGEGTRLRPFTHQRPKPLVPWLDGPIVTHARAAYASAGVERVLVNAWHCADQVVDWAAGPGDIEADDVVVEERLMGTGGGVRGLGERAALVGDRDAYLVVWNGDIVADIDVAGLVARVQEAGAAAALVTRPPIAGERTIDIDVAGRVCTLPGADGSEWRRPGCGMELEPASYAGVLVIRGDALVNIPLEPSCVLRDGLGPALASGMEVVAFSHCGFWSDLGTPARYVAAAWAALASDAFGLVSSGAYRRVPAEGDQSEASYLGRDTLVDEGAVLQRAIVAGCARIDATNPVSKEPLAASTRSAEAVSVVAAMVVESAPLRRRPGAALLERALVIDGERVALG